MSNTIVVKTQKELDKLPDSFKEFTYIEIRSDKNITIEVKKSFGSASVWAFDSASVRASGSASVRASGSASVVAYDSASVVASDSASVWAYGSASVRASGSASVVAYGSASVWAFDSASVVASDSASVRASGSASVQAYDSASVQAYDSASVRASGSASVVASGSASVQAYDSASVVAYGSASVVASGNSMIAVLSALVVIHKIKQYAIVALDGVKVKLPKKDGTATVIHRKIALHDIESFIDLYDLKVENDSVILYKSVNPNTLCDFQTGKVKYEGIVECQDFDSNKDRECGGGLHLCATPELTQTFNVGKILKCRVKLKDIVVFGGNIQKVRCKKVEVLGEVG